MVRELAEGEGMAEIWELWDMVIYLVFPREFSLAGEESDCEGGEVFGDRSDMEDGGRSDWDLVLELGRAVALAIDEATIAGDRDSCAWSGRVVPRLEDRIDRSDLGMCDSLCREWLVSSEYGEGGEDRYKREYRLSSSPGLSAQVVHSSHDIGLSDRCGTLRVEAYFGIQ